MPQLNDIFTLGCGLLPRPNELQYYQKHAKLLATP